MNTIISDENLGNILLTLLGEIFFTLLPFIVSIIIFAYRMEILNIFYVSEWSIASAVLIGQTLIKIIQGSLANKNSHEERTTLFATFLVVFGLVPSLAVVIIVMMSDPVSLSLAIVQVIIFIFSLIVFFVFGTVGEILKYRGTVNRQN